MAPFTGCGAMKKTRFTDEQMVMILRGADQRAVTEVAKKHGVSTKTIDAWHKRFGDAGTRRRQAPAAARARE